MTKPATDTLTVTIERDMPHPPDKIWRALTQQQLLQEWLMNNDFQPVVGHHFSFRGDWGAVDCQVLAVEPNKSLSYTWSAMGLDSVVTYTLTPSGAGTHLRVEQSGFRPEMKQAFGGAKAGWQAFLKNLDQLLARSN